jgi:hypothetical protein
MKSQALTTQPTEADRDDAWLVWALVVIAFLLRVGAIVVLQAWNHPNAMEHAPIAYHLVHGEGFAFRDWGYFGPSSVQSPPYPALLAGLFLVLGVDSPGAYFAALLINAALGALTVWGVHRMTRAWGGSPRVAMAAAVLFALWPTQVYLVTHAQAIALITFIVVFCLHLFHRALDTGRAWPWVCFSGLGCLGMLTEPVLLPPMALTGLLIFVWPAQSLTFRGRLRNAAILLIAALLIVGPWSLRNRQVHGQWVPVKSTFWVNVWKANNPHATGTDRLPLSDEQRERLGEHSVLSVDEIARDPQFDARRQYDALTPEQKAQLLNQPEVQREKVFQAFAMDWIKANPSRYLELCGIRFLKTVWIDWDNPKAHNLVFVVSRAALIVLAGIGLILALMRRWRLGYAAFLVLGFMALYTLTITAARFSLPLEPIALALSALSLVTLYEWIKPDQGARSEEPGARS